MDTASVFIIMIIAILLLITVSGVRDRRAAERKAVEKLRKDFGRIGGKQYPEGRFEQIPGYYIRHLRDFTIDDVTWGDLEMDLLFAGADRTCSAPGEEYLYWLLRSPALSAEETAFTEDQIVFWDDAHEELRITVQRTLQRYGRGGRHSIYDHLELLSDAPVRPLAADLPAILLPLISAALLFVSVQAGVVLLLLSLSFNMVTYFRVKGRIQPYLETFRYVLRILACADRLDKILKDSGKGSDNTGLSAAAVFPDEVKELRSGAGSFTDFRRGSGILLRARDYSGNPADILLDYLCILFHLDLIKFGSMQRQIKGRDLTLDRLIAAVGRIDASISIASYRKSLPVFSVPELEKCAPVIGGDAKSENIFFEAEGLYHPLLRDPVPNDFATVKPVLLTGSNASGKSTFLKAAAVCAILSQTIRTAPAARYRSTFFRVMTSMALRDSLVSGESYFIVEIKSLRRIIEAGAHGNGESRSYSQAPVLCCIDEVLRGTNTIERISASTEILKALAESGMLVFAATHDLELAELLKGIYDNYHFSEEFCDGDVHFSYKILPGETRTRNAIRLLSSMGYSGEIVEKAGARAELFMRTGKWE